MDARVAGPIAGRKLYRLHDTLLNHTQLHLSIFFSVVIFLGLAYYWVEGLRETDYFLLASISGLLMYIVYRFMGVYRQSEGYLFGRAMTRFYGLWILAKAWLVVVLLVVLYTFFTKSSTDFSRVVIAGWAVLGYLSQLGIYVVSYWLARKYFLHFCDPINTVVVGSNALAAHLVDKISGNPWLPDNIVGVVDEDQESLSAWSDVLAPAMGGIDALSRLISEYGVRRIYIALPLSKSTQVESIYRMLQWQSVDIIWAPDIFSLDLGNYSLREVAGVPLVTLSESPAVAQGQAFTKAAMDKTIAGILLLLLSPLMLLTAIAVKLSSPGPVLFKQQRHGWDGQVIEVWKFRSMRVHEKKEGKLELAQRDDHRFTPIGRFIRRMSIDELPQLFNVLHGTMSLVGPRPHALEVNQFYAQHIPSLMSRHRIKPGITGLAQINGWRGGDDCTVDTLDKMRPRVEHDIRYIKNYSLLLDLKILLITPFKLFSKNIY
ncbi:MAG: undecaprenyl-phosphate glucose phosphotransferase [Pseudomonadales bacterium]